MLRALLLSIFAQWVAPIPSPATVSTLSRPAFWGSPWASGIPGPTADCIAAPSGGAFSCRGRSGTVSVAGSPTTEVADPWPGRAVAFAEAGEHIAVAATPSEHATWTQCASFRPDAVTGGAQTLLFVGSAVNAIHVFRYDNYLFVKVLKADGNTQLTPATGLLQAGAWKRACWSYEYVSDGASALRVNCGGGADAVTNAVGPINSAPDGWVIGDGAGYQWIGQVGRITEWQGWAASAEQLAAMVQAP